MQKVVLATGNPGKVRELASLLADFGLDIVAQTELGVSSAVVHPAVALPLDSHIAKRNVAVELADVDLVMLDVQAERYHHLIILAKGSLELSREVFVVMESGYPLSGCHDPCGD